MAAGLVYACRLLLYFRFMYDELGRIDGPCFSALYDGSSVDGDGTVHISRERHKQCLLTRHETTSGARKPH